MSWLVQTLYIKALRGTRSIIDDITMVGMMLWLNSGIEKLAWSDTMVMSAAAARAKPKPSARPWTTAMTGATELRSRP